MINLVFTLASAILGVAMFGAILLAPGKSQAETSIASSELAGDGSPAIVSVTKHRAFDGLVIDDVRFANANANGAGTQQDLPAKPPRPSTDQEPRTQMAQIAKTQVTWQMAAQIPDTRTMFRQM